MKVSGKTGQYIARLAIAMALMLLAVPVWGGYRAVQAAACAPAWSATAAYTVGTQVSHVGKNWTLVWAGYTPGAVEPGSLWNTPNIWQDNGVCSGGTGGATATNTAQSATATRTNTPAATITAGGPTATRTNTPAATATSAGGTAVCTSPNWDSSAVNYNTGDKVTYNNRTWQAKYWTNTTPGSADWTDLGACTMPTATPTWTPLPAGVSGRYVIGYFPEWGVYGRDYQAADLAPYMSYLTHLQYAFVQVDVNGNCVLFDTWAADGKPGKAPYTQNGNLRQLKAMRDAVAPNVRLVLSVGGWTLSENFSDVLASSTKRATMVSTCKALLTKYGWDGIDIDWEYPVEGGENGNNAAYHDSNDAINLVSLFQEMRASYGQSAVLSLAMGAGESQFRHIKMDQLAQHASFISLMTYDFNGAWQNKTAHNAPLYASPNDPDVIDTTTLLGRANTDHAVRAHLNGITQANAWLDNNNDGMFDGQRIPTIGGVPSTKLVMGVPFYGRSWANVSSATNQGMFQQGNNGALTMKGTCNCEPDYSELPSAMRSTYPGVQSCGGGSWEESVFDFDDIAYLDNSCGFTRGWDSSAKVPYLYGGTYSNGKSGWVSYDDAESFCYKAKYALDKNLGGLMFWEVTQNRNTANNSLWRALADYRAGTPGASAGINCGAVQPTATRTNTPQGPTATRTNTPLPATATRTNTPLPATATATRTNTPLPATATRTNTPLPATATATRTNTPQGPTATRTNTPLPPTATRTNTPQGPTATRTNTPQGPTATRTNTPQGPTATRTNTPQGPTATRTNTPQGPTATRTNTPQGPTATRTNTPQGPTATRTNTPQGPTATRTNTPQGPTATRTNTPQGPTATRTNTPQGPTATRTNTPLLPTATRTNTPLLPTATRTNTPLLPTATRTNTPLLPTATRTNTPLLPTATMTRTNTPVGPTPTTGIPDGRQAIFYFADWGAVLQHGSGVTPVPGSILEVADIRPFANKITVINYAFIAPDQNGNCYFITPTALTHVGKAPYTAVGVPNQLVQLRNEFPHLKLMFSVGGWTDSDWFSSVAADATKRANFINSCVGVMNQYGFDGIDIDWEHPLIGGENLYATPYVNTNDPQNYVTLLQAFRAHAGMAGKRLSVAVVAAAYGYRWLLPDQMAQYLDTFNLMTYDLHGQWDYFGGADGAKQHSITGHQSAIYDNEDPDDVTIDAAVNAFIGLGVPPTKIMLGAPFYGRPWINAQNVNSKGGQTAYQVQADKPASENDWFLQYYQIKNLIANNGYIEYWDAAAKASYAYNPNVNGGHWITYDNARAICAKANYIKQRNLGGMMVWELRGSPDGELINAMVNCLSGANPYGDAPVAATFTPAPLPGCAPAWAAGVDYGPVGNGKDYVSDAGLNWKKLWWPDTTTRPSLQTNPNTAAWSKVSKCDANAPTLTPVLPLVSCTDAVDWVSGSAYVQGSLVKRSSYKFKANWWTTTDPLTNYDSTTYSKDWQILGICSGAATNTPAPTTAVTLTATAQAPTATRTNTPAATATTQAATATRTNTPVVTATTAANATATPTRTNTLQAPTATPTASGASSCPAWSATAGYYPNDKVTYNGGYYKVIWAGASGANMIGLDPVTWLGNIWGAISASECGPLPTATTAPTNTPLPTATKTVTPGGPTVTPVPTSASVALPKRVIVGYWHNFDNGSVNIQLRNVSNNFNVIQVSFAEPPAGVDNGTLAFTPYNSTVSQFQADVAYLKSQGKKVLISIGGANVHLQLTDSTKTTNFINSMTNIINTYGFDGLDIDLEGSSLSLNAGDTNLLAPTTPAIVNLINATKQIRTNTLGANFVLTMAPETAYVQGGQTAYGGIWGAYLPLIHGLRNELTILHVQHYNAGGMTCNGVQVNQGTTNFHVCLTDMMITGFVAGGQTFPGLRADQVAFGVPASPQAASSGQTDNATITASLNCLIAKTSCGTYVPANAHSNMRGIMTWSINWDQYNNYSFSNNARTALNALP